MTTATIHPQVTPDTLVGEWQLDSAHTTVSFVTKYLVFSKVRGTFTKVSGAATVNADPTRSTAHFAAETASIDTGNEQRDGHLRGADFFDVEAYPTIEYTVTGVEPAGGQSYRVSGDLTMHGVTRPVSFDAEFLGTAKDPYGRDKVAFSAATSVDREQWGLTWNQALETGGVLVSKNVDIEIDGQLLRPQPQG